MAGNQQPFRTRARQEPTNQLLCCTPETIKRNVNIKRRKATNQKVNFTDELFYFAENNLWRQIFRCSAQRPRSSFDSFGKPKVSDLTGKQGCYHILHQRNTIHLSQKVQLFYLEISLTINQQIFWF